MPYEKLRSCRLAALARRASSIRVRIVLLAIIAVAPLLFDRVRLLEASRTDQMAAAQAQALDLARIGVDKQEDVLISARSLLQTVSHAIERIPPQFRECNHFLSDTASDVPWVKAISVVNLKGLVVCSSSPQALGLDVSDRAYFHRALAGPGLVMSGFLYPRAQTGAAIIASYGKRDPSGQTEAVINVVVDLRWIGQLASVVEQRPGAVALLVDAAGMVLAGHPDPGAWAGRDVADYPLMREIRTRSQGTVTSAGFDTVRRIWGFRPIADGAGHLLVGIDEREVLAGVQREMNLAYMQLALVVILVLLGAWTFGERTILSPIRTLARAAERIGRGDLTVRTAGRPWAPEFLPLTRSLDSMAARLAAREHSLRTESDRFRELATLDSLTGLSNRRAFDDHLAAEWRRAADHQTPLALLMIDVDHFKLYNDRYGHLEGDTCLRAISAILSDMAVWGGRGVRYGGEEFALLIPGADGSDARRVAERVRRAVETLGIAHADAPCGAVTVSIGLGSLVPRPETSPSALVEAADAGLYSAKRRGRNTVVEHAAFELAEAS